MKSMVLNLWAWIITHPEQVMGAVLALLAAIAAATVANARAKGAPVGWFARFVDRLAVRTRANAANAGWSWPLVGRSIFEAAVDASAPSDPPPASPGFSEAALMRWIAAVSLVAAAVVWLIGCSPTLPADLYRGVGVGVAVTAAGGRELALLEARECLGKPSRVEAEACLVPWRARWSAIAQAWQGAASRAQSLAHVVASVDAQLERRFPAMDAGAGAGGAADAAVSE